MIIMPTVYPAAFSFKGDNLKLYFCNISDISASELTEWFGKMSSERKEAVRKLRIPHKQKLKIAADNLCRNAISDFCGIAPDKIRFGVTENGKPFAKEIDVQFNISHSGDFVVCAVSDKEIGIDIEKIRDINPRITRKFSDEKERIYIDSHKNGLFEIWTLKEAYFKCIGTGLCANIKNVSFDINNKKITCSEKGFECLFHEVAEGYICSTCEKIN